ncbi:MAG: hypothetical protein KDA80_02750 [Planctomycetaceae bacterium]|nr:hypothetical protein [Planctomycetaceae bacterium]
MSLQPLPIVVDQASRPDSNGIGFVTGDSTDRFTTVESERQVFNRIEQEGIGATFDLRDNPDVLAAVEDLALARLGNGGVVEFLGGDAEFLNFYGRRNGFVSEDVNSNGILDPGEDINSNGMLDLALPGQLLEFDPRWDYGYFVEVPVIGGNVGALPGANVGRSKLTESASPIPRDRLFFNYSYFDNAALTPAGVDVSRLTTGFEKTFWCQRASIEVRLPAASTLDATIPISGPIESGEQELGNLTMYLKGLLWQWERLAISGGVGWTLPTAPGVNVVDPITENTIYRVENSSVHVLPFLGALWTPTPRFFMQGFLQFDLDSNGNRVYVSDVDNRGRFNGNLYGVGRAEDHGFAYFDMGIGYWAYLNTTNRGWITAIAPTIEYHLNTTIDNPGDFRGVGRNGLIYDFGSADNITSSNIVVGVNTMLRRGWNVTAGATFGAGDDKQFDGEFRLIINKYFGGSNTGTPIPSF